MAREPSRRSHRALVAVVAVGTIVGCARPVAAHGGSLGGAARESVAVPTWLFLITGGAAVGASFLLASFVTDRRLIEELHAWERPVRIPRRGVLTAIVRLVGVIGLVAVVVLGFVGPQQGLSNLGVLIVWVGWWAGYTATTYLIGDTWSVLNPWRTIASWLPTRNRAVPPHGAWPSVVGLLTLIWIEVVSPLADDPTLLATVVVVYSIVTFAGSVVFGPTAYFERIDPVTRVFRNYGHFAPVTSVSNEDSVDGADGVKEATSCDGRERYAIRGPGVGLAASDLVTEETEVAFIVALLWATTYDGFVATPAWRSVATPLVTAGIPPHLLYSILLVAGFALFLSVYRFAARMARRTGETYLSTALLARRFAPPLVAIAAGYHFAHYLGYFLSLVPALIRTLGSPLTPVTSVPVFVLPGWFGAVPIASVLAGHLVAIWIAHATAFDLFPGRLQAIRSQYPFIAVMVLYTMTSLWIVTQPSIQPPFLYA